MIKSEQRKQIDARLEILEEYILFLKEKGLNDEEIQQYVYNLSHGLFVNMQKYTHI